jgi:hypothetical protein
MKRTLVFLAVIAATVLPLAAPAQAADTATITGRVEIGPKGTPLAGAGVSLNQGNSQTQEGQEGIDKTTTDERGDFTFTGVQAGDPWQYDVTVTYKDVDYNSPGLSPKPGETTQTKITVYEPTDSDKQVGVGQWIVYLDQDPSGGMAVEQDITFVNAGDKTFTGTTMGPGAPPLTAQIPVAPSANQDSLQTLGLFSLYEGGVVGSAYGTTAPIVPGVNQAGTIRYVTEPTPLDFPISYPTQTFTLYVAPEISVTPTGLTAAGTESIPGGGANAAPITYSVYSAQNIAPGQVIHLQVEAAGGSGTTKLPAFALFLIGLAIVAALFLAVVRLRADSGRRSESKGGPKKAPSAQTKARPKNAKPKQPSHAEHHTPGDDDLEADLLIAEIAALDGSFEQGLIREEDYRRIRAARKDQLRRTHREEGDD